MLPWDDTVEAGLAQLSSVERTALLVLAILKANEADALGTVLELHAISLAMAMRLASSDVRTAIAEEYGRGKQRLETNEVVLVLH